ncbi:hypothetical protein UYSO10_2464 [Kosakonia radicincitans]|uniref:hypothetical protein n=1 Tax=Kosakonia radicincitans TaxID=283686 RepID=UPI0011825E1C|nr:hypothetical protein [Kosakonia radicincitans]VVT48707.1 hypothetical protein UYSO10_2464 [Kosakonia radicincitans]
MKELTSESPFSDYVTLASGLGFEITPASIGYELWFQNNYKGGFTTLDALAKELNLHLELHQLRSQEETEQNQKAIKTVQKKDREARVPFVSALSRLSDAREAAVMRNGKVVGLCRTLVSKGGEVCLAACRNGVPVNMHWLPVSFSKKNIQSANDSGNYFSAFEYDDELYYVSDNSNE